MHNGKIGLLESKVGEGSTFYFTLPLTEEEITETADPPKRQLLAIDEDPETVQIYQRFLKGSDFSVETISHSKGIITEIISKQPSAVIIDIASKNLDAWTLVQQIRETPQTAALPILVCSMTDQKEKAMSLGVTEYLLKPFLRDEFLQSVHRLIHTSTTVNILAIDDNEEDIRLIFRLLENQTRYHLCQASNSVEAMAVLEKNQIDVIILDLFLPDVNGFAFLEDLKKHRTYSTAPVIVVTGADLTPAQHEKLTTFGHIFLTKGFLRSGDLINSIENALKI
jgi:CheY-like chemotaxis protein